VTHPGGRTCRDACDLDNLDQRQLVGAVRAGLAAAANPTKAPQMQAYMKSALPYYGVPMPEVRRIARAVFTGHPLEDRGTWESTVRALFDEAAHREEWYAALMLLNQPRYAAYVDGEAMPLLRHLITAGAWWDVVDDVAHRVGDALLADRERVEPVVRGWIDCDDLWLRRSAVICQLGHRERTDLLLLVDAIEPAMPEREFFLRKAIGWALREYAKTDPAWVRRFVAEHEDGLSGLSRREALKHL
jgi:3-methyladenine DNA glycosylase AlkD